MKPDRHCIRCWRDEKEVRGDSIAWWCYAYGDKLAKYHSYTLTDEIKWSDVWEVPFNTWKEAVNK
jgi:hypothetical protein